ncbi:hypothetical protein RHMOL_Rhmol12G0174800 [Rhododendron molle]|uniref:Uncharacterized protein n=1 Tax=Rhododendron molle TaxID=49168 RepID=A0ACC0LKF6_RHOML|nr:hypothetical protein RHMOL_Rhmol12G0174800 [Rhododendron molle]
MTWTDGLVWLYLFTRPSQDWELEVVLVTQFFELLHGSETLPLMEGRLRWRHDQRFIGWIFLSSCCWIRQMAMEAAFPAALPGAQIVANAFVEQYYHILHQSPELVYKFYQDSSVLSRPNSNGVMTSVTAMQAINEKILSMEYQNYKAEIKTADAQDSYKKGVIVLVRGCLTGKEDSVRKKFTQTFFLAPQENGYYVLNDVFRYVDESQSLDFHSVSENGINDNTQLAPSMLDPESIRGPDQPSLEPVATIEAEDLNGAEVCDPSECDEGSVIEEEIIDDPPAHSSSNEVATVVKVTKVVAKASTPVYVPTHSMRVAAANADQQSLGSAKPSPELEAPAPSDSAPESTIAQEKGINLFVYLPPTIGVLRRSSKNLGPLSMVESKSEATRSVLRFRYLYSSPTQHFWTQYSPSLYGGQQQGFCFGFVEFESLDAMQAAIELEAAGEGGILQGGVDSAMTASGAGATLVVAGAMAEVSSETQASFQADPRAQVDALEKVINALIRTEVGEEVVRERAIRVLLQHEWATNSLLEIIFSQQKGDNFLSFPFLLSLGLIFLFDIMSTPFLSSVSRLGYVVGVLPFILLLLVVKCSARPLYPLPSKINRQPLQTFRPFNIAHRGSNGEIPEETAAAYLRAIEEGADFIETDILASKDGALICFHDITLDATTDVAEHKEFANRKRTYDVQGVNTTGFFTVDFTLKELKTLRVKQRYPFRNQQYNGKYQVITFDEFISIALDASRVVGIYPEIKNPVFINQHVKWSDGKTFEDKFVETLKKNGYKGSYLSKEWLKQPAIIQSFAPTSLIYVSNLTDLPKVFLIDDVTIPTQDTNQSYWEITSDAYLDYIKDYVMGIGPWKDTVVPVANNYLQAPTDLVARAHAHNLQESHSKVSSFQVHPYTYRNENSFLHFYFNQDPYAEYDYWINKVGVDGLFTDFTGSLHKFQEWTSPLSHNDDDESELLHKIASMVSNYRKH